MESQDFYYWTLNARRNDSGTAKELIAVYVTSKANNPSWCEATRGKFVDEYWNAIKLEIATLKNIDA